MMIRRRRRNQQLAHPYSLGWWKIVFLFLQFITSLKVGFVVKAAWTSNNHCLQSRRRNNLAPHLHAPPPSCRQQQQQQPRSTTSSCWTATCRHLNRLLFDPSEVDQHNNNNNNHNNNETSPNPVLSVTLSKDDYRTIHVASILQLRNGDTVRAGLVGDSDDDDAIIHSSNNSIRISGGGYLTDVATVEWLPEGKVKKAEPLKNGNPPGSLRIYLNDLVPAFSTSSTTRTTTGSSTTSNAAASDYYTPPPPVSLILALPRPLQLGRILPMIAQLGVDQLVLTHAQKVPRDYFGSHLFRQSSPSSSSSSSSLQQTQTQKQKHNHHHYHHLRQRLIEGLAQAGTDVRLPKVHVIRPHQLSLFWKEDLDRLFPITEYARVIAHPERRKLTTMNDDNNNNHVHHPTAVTAMTQQQSQPSQSQQQQQQSPPQQQPQPRRMRHVVFPPHVPPRIVLAIGPEGGWEEPNELDTFLQHGFQQITLGTRVLRSDVAVVSLLSLAHEHVVCRC